MFVVLLTMYLKELYRLINLMFVVQKLRMMHALVIISVRPWLEMQGLSLGVGGSGLYSKIHMGRWNDYNIQNDRMQ